MIIPSDLVINADDFGANSTKNLAITRCFALNIINSATVITNAEGFQEAIKLSKENNFSDKIGLHVNLTEGKSLTDLSISKLVDDKGFFMKRNGYEKYIYLSSEVKKLVKIEIEAQLNTLYQNNITPTHIDSHHHVHTLPWLVSPFLDVAKKHNIKIRIAQTWNENNNILVPYYRNVINWMYKKNGLNFTDHFETIESYTNGFSSKSKKPGLVEIMVHPDLDSNNDIYDSTDGIFLETALNSIILKKNGLNGKFR